MIGERLFSRSQHRCHREHIEDGRWAEIAAEGDSADHNAGLERPPYPVLVDPAFLGCSEKQLHRTTREAGMEDKSNRQRNGSGS